MAISSDQYVVDNDITEALPDGRVIVLGHKGEVMHVNEARARGFIKSEAVGPSEIKAEADTATDIKVGKGGITSRQVKLTGNG